MAPIMLYEQRLYMGVILPDIREINVEIRSRIGISGLILGLRLANERRRCFVTTPLIGWVQA